MFYVNRERMISLAISLLFFFVLSAGQVFADARTGLSDVNRDGKVDSLDTTFVGTYYGIVTPTGLAALANVDQAGAVDLFDIVLVSADFGYILSSCELEDINNDGGVDQADLTIVSGYSGQTDNSTNMIADLDGDGSVGPSDLVRVQACLPVPTSTPTPTSAPPSQSTEQSKSEPNPNIRPNWKHEVMAGPTFVGTPTYIKSEVMSVFIDKTTHHDDVNVTFTQPSLEDLADYPYPWAQGLNAVSEIVNISAVSAFNGYSIGRTDNPFIVVLSYSPDKLQGISPSLLSISHYDGDKDKWLAIQNPMVIDQSKHTIATTTDTFGLFSVTYPSNVWQ